MVDRDETVKGPVVHAPETLNGRRVTLVRGGEEVRGVLMAIKNQFTNEELVFKWTDKNGTASISPLTGEELEAFQNGN